MMQENTRGASFLISIILTICFVHQKETVAEKISFGGTSIAKTLTIKLASAQIDYINEEYVGKNTHMRVLRLSKDTSPVMNGVISFLKDLPREMNNTFIAYQKKENVWRESFVKGTVPLCELLESKLPLYRVFYDYTNFPRKCPVHKGNYTVEKFDIDKGEIPPVTVNPSREWKIKLGYICNKITYLTFSFECHVTLKEKSRGSKSRHPKR